MLDLHPIISSFPLCLVFTIIVFEIHQTCSKQANNHNPPIKLLYIMLTALLSITFISGLLIAEWNDNPTKTKALDQHYQLAKLNIFILISVLTFYALKLSNTNKTCLALYYLSLLGLFTNLIITGYLGGKLVFIFGFGVQIP